MILPHRKGPRLNSSVLMRSSVLNSDALAPSLRGWIIALSACVGLAVVVPYIDFVIRCSQISFNNVPVPSIFLVFALIVIFNLVLIRFKASLALSPQDYALIFCMTMLVSPIPGAGLLSWLVSSQMGSMYYASLENRWAETLWPYLPQELFPRDPTDPLSTAPRPVEWFYTGLPNLGESAWSDFLQVPWTVLAGPYLRWSIGLTFLIGIFIALGALLHKQWTEKERLPFPLMQVPQTLLAGLGSFKSQGFFHNRLAWWGIAIAFLVPSWNAMGDYFSDWPRLPLRNLLDAFYFTEPPLLHLQPVMVHLYLAVIGIMFLVSLEVSFSLWLFTIFFLKLGLLVACSVFVMGESGRDWNAVQIFQGQGLGAFVIMVLGAFFVARGQIWLSFKQALRGQNNADEEILAPRTIWLLLGGCYLGLVSWLTIYGVDWYYAAAAVAILSIGATGIARLIAEGGVVSVRSNLLPHAVLNWIVTPGHLGTQNVAMLFSFSRVFSFDSFRAVPLTNILGALHLSSKLQLKPKPLLIGLFAALFLTLLVSFFSFYYSVYSVPGGASHFGWQYVQEPQNYYGNLNNLLIKVDLYQQQKVEYAAQGRTIPDSELPQVARPIWRYLRWVITGMVVMTIFLLLRTRLVWWPHPIGYVMLMSHWQATEMCFSYFIGWLLKASILKFGGHSLFTRWKPFFVGLIVGEVIAILFWIAIAFFVGRTDGYRI